MANGRLVVGENDDPGNTLLYASLENRFGCFDCKGVAFCRDDVPVAERSRDGEGVPLTKDSLLIEPRIKEGVLVRSCGVAML